jgi:hypothetical protein
VGSNPTLSAMIIDDCKLTIDDLAAIGNRQFPDAIRKPPTKYPI